MFSDASLPEWINTVVTFAGLGFAGYQIRESRRQSECDAEARQYANALAVYVETSLTGDGEVTSVRNDSSTPVFDVVAVLPGRNKSERVGVVQGNSSRPLLVCQPVRGRLSSDVVLPSLAFKDAHGAVWLWENGQVRRHVQEGDGPASSP